MTWVGLQPRVVDTVDGRVVFEHAGQSQGVISLLSHTQRECLDTPVEQEACVGVECAAQMVQLATDVFDEIMFADNSPGDDVGMPVSVGIEAIEDLTADFDQALRKAAA